MLYSADASLLKDVVLADTAVRNRINYNLNDPPDVSLLGSGDKAFLVAQSPHSNDFARPAAVTIVSKDGEVLGSTLVALPQLGIAIGTRA